MNSSDAGTGAALAALAGMGWTPDDGLVRAIAATAARRHPVAAVVPPAGRYLAPALAPALAALPAGERALVLAPEGMLDDVAGVVRRLAAELGTGVLAGRSLGRLSRRIGDDAVAVVVTTMATAGALQARSSLPSDGIGLVAIAWPELWDDLEALPALLQDLPGDAQRIIVSASPGVLATMVERHGRKAFVAGPSGGTPEGAQIGPVRVVVTPDSEREAALQGILDVLDPGSLAVWAPDEHDHAAIRRVAGAMAIPTTVGRDLPAADCLVTWSLPRPEELAALVPLAGELVILLPPVATGWLSRVANPVRPLRLPGRLEALEGRLNQQRRLVADRLAATEPNAGMLAIAPLLERFDAAAIAGTLFELWQAGRPAAAHPAPEAGPAGATGTLWINVGRKDGATPADFVAVLTKELGLDRTQVGRIEIKDGFSLVDVPAAQLEDVARQLEGKSLRQKRLSARADRAAPAPRGAPPSRDRPRSPAGPRGPRRPS